MSEFVKRYLVASGSMHEHTAGSYIKASDYEKLFIKYEELKNAGNSISNCCYNLSQSEGEVLSKQWCNSTKEAYCYWDSVKESQKATIKLP